MSIISEISRIENAASIIKAKTVSLGLSVSSPSKLGEHAAAINAISARTVSTSKLTADTTAVTISQGYYNSSATISVDKMTAPSVTLSTSAQTISCDDKMMDGNITIPSANGYYTGSSTPDDSIGNDGDIYLVTSN